MTIQISNLWIMNWILTVVALLVPRAEAAASSLNQLLMFIVLLMTFHQSTEKFVSLMYVVSPNALNQSIAKLGEISHLLPNPLINTFV